MFYFSFRADLGCVSPRCERIRAPIALLEGPNGLVTAREVRASVTATLAPKYIARSKRREAFERDTHLVETQRRPLRPAHRRVERLRRRTAEPKQKAIQPNSCEKRSS